MNLYKCLLNVITKYKLNLGVYILLSIILSISSVLLPYVNSKFISSLTTNTSNNYLYSLIKLLFFISVLNLILTYISNITKVILNNRLAFDLQYLVLEHIKRVPISFFEGIDTSYLTKKINEDSNLIICFIIDTFINILTNIIMLCAVVYLLVRMDLNFLLIFLGIMPLYIIIYFIFRKKLYKLSYNCKENQSIFFGRLNEQLKYVYLIKIHSCFYEMSIKLTKAFSTFIGSIKSYYKLSAIFTNINMLLTVLIKLIVFAYGGIQVRKGNIFVGDLLLINTYFFILVSITNYFINIFKDYQEFKVSCDRLTEIIGIPKERNGKNIVNNIDKLTIENLCFYYEESNAILKNLNFTFYKGKIYRIKGANGSGKSTLINIIIGLTQNYNGEIYYNSSNIKQIDMYELRKENIGTVEQEPVLFSDSLHFNLTFNLEDDVLNKETDDFISKEVKKYKFIQTLLELVSNIDPEQLNSTSGGEKQKIALLRTFIKNPDVIILDEPTSALDGKSTEILKNFLLQFKEDKIIIIITHDNSLLDIFDETLDINSYK